MRYVKAGTVLRLKSKEKLKREYNVQFTSNGLETIYCKPFEVVINKEMFAGCDKLVVKQDFLVNLGDLNSSIRMFLHQTEWNYCTYMIDWECLDKNNIGMDVE